MKGTAEVRSMFRQLMDMINSAETMRALGGFSIKTIQKRTRGEGKGVSRAGGISRKLKRVTPDYAEQRRRKKGKHPAAATGTTSNLTLFGPLINTLVIKRATKTDLRIGFLNLKEEKKAEGQERQGRTFMVLSGKEIKDAKKFLSDLVANQVR